MTSALPETLPETIESGPLCITDLFQNMSVVAYFQSIIIFLYLFQLIYYSTFQCGRKNIFRNFCKNIFAHKKLNKQTISKSCLLMAVGSFFFLWSPACQKQPRTLFSIYISVYSTILCKISCQQSRLYLGIASSLAMNGFLELCYLEQS